MGYSTTQKSYLLYNLATKSLFVKSWCYLSWDNCPFSVFISHFFFLYIWLWFFPLTCSLPINSPIHLSHSATIPPYSSPISSPHVSSSPTISSPISSLCHSTRAIQPPSWLQDYVCSSQPSSPSSLAKGSYPFLTASSILIYLYTYFFHASLSHIVEPKTKQLRALFESMLLS